MVASSVDPVANEPITPVLTENANEPVQEDIAAFDGNDFYNPFHSPVLEEAESSLTFQDPSNMHEFYQTHRSTDKWTKNHPIEQVIGDSSKPVMTRHRVHTNAEMYMYALTVGIRRIGLGQYGVLGFIFMDTAYGRRWIRRIGNCEYAFSCEDLALDLRRYLFLDMVYGQN
ncbi:hypothetical protein Tco_0881826 [Tanacetum coccineum]